MARIRRHRRDTVQSPLETYLREINEMALLTADEEKELAHRIAIVDHGRLIACGPLAALRGQAAVDGSLEEVFLTLTGHAAQATKNEEPA